MILYATTPWPCQRRTLPVNSDLAWQLYGLLMAMIFSKSIHIVTIYNVCKFHCAQSHTFYIVTFSSTNCTKFLFKHRKQCKKTDTRSYPSKRVKFFSGKTKTYMHWYKTTGRGKFSSEAQTIYNIIVIFVDSTVLHVFERSHTATHS